MRKTPKRHNSRSVSHEEWNLILRPKSGWLDLRIGDLWRYRDLIKLFVRRDFVAAYKQTILGPLWYLIQPLLTTITFTVIFGKVARVSTDGLPKFLFYMAGVTGWEYFADCLKTTSETFIQNAPIFGKVYFPRLTVPISLVISGLFKFFIQFGFFLLFIAYYIFKGASIRLSVAACLTPLLILLMAGLGLGAGIIISSLTTKYRDLRFLVQFGIQLLMYTTPVVYPLSSIPEKYRWIILANPMTPIIESFRYAFLGAGSLNWLHLAYSGVATIMILFVGILIFNRIQSNFMDTV
jgi:lipopolysaccharide transport system permease protein